jgi:signal transduction histidine kinase
MKFAIRLAKDVASEPGQLDLVKKIAGGVRRLESLVSHVLQFTRQMQPRPIQADLALIIDEAVALAAPQIESAGISVVIDGPRPFPVSVDPLLMGQVLLNLVLNAVEAAGHGGLVRISSGPPRPQGTETRFFIVVEDSGPGIAPQIMDRIFNPFFTTRDNGTGLGLAIVHRVVESHDGSVTACNRDEGGARFEIRV